MVVLDESWAIDVSRMCDPVFEAADVGFVRQPLPTGPGHVVDALLWEADPQRFVGRYPDSGLVDAYGGAEQFAGVHCVDFWVYVERDTGRCRLSVEGWNLPELWLELRGHGAADGAAIADTFARILGVPSPRLRS